MTENHYWKAITKLFASRKSAPAATGLDAPGTPPQSSSLPRIYLSELKFHNGTKLSLGPDSIVVLTGPNNSGKSSVLKAIDECLCERDSYVSAFVLQSPVVSEINVRAEGSPEQFKDYLEKRCLRGRRRDTVLIGQFQVYSLSQIPEDLKSDFRRSAVSTMFVSRMNASARLKAVEPTTRGDWTRQAPTEPLQWLDFEVDAEDEISRAFKDAFGRPLIVNRAAGDKIHLHVGDGEEPNFDSFKTYMNWLSGLPRLVDQGDGMKSFAAALMGIKIHPKSVILLDEPEAFLHHPQAIRLAKVVADSGTSSPQVWVATHSVDIVQGLLEKSNHRINVVRLDRRGDTLSAKVLEPEQIRTLWSDPLLRTSDALSALFHEVAVICEGETDARFLRVLSEAVTPSHRLPDAKFLHVGGKDKIRSIASALRALDLPICVLADIDILSEQKSFVELFVILGGDKSLVEDDVGLITRHLGQRAALISGDEAARSLKAIAEDVKDQPRISESVRNRLSSLIKETSSWSRLKVDGYRGLDSPTVVQAFLRVYDRARAVGLLINREGELEGLCRDARKSPKSAWLNDVLARDLIRDPNLEDARRLLADLRECMIVVRGKG